LAFASGRLASGDAAEHAVHGGPADDGFRDFGVAFVVASQSAVGGEPRAGAFYDSAAWGYGEAALLGRFARDDTATPDPIALVT
jgi:hypothetical protein